MICRNCNSEIPDNVKFCPKCGESLADSKKSLQIEAQNKVFADNSTDSMKIRWSYVISMIGALICFIGRCKYQEEIWNSDGWFEGLRVLGMDMYKRPWFLLAPIVSSMIVSLLVVSDENSSLQRRANAIVGNLVFIVLSILFVYFDIPNQYF